MSKVTLGYVSEERKETSNDKSLNRMVGLEHLVPGEVVLSKWDTTNSAGFTKVFHDGDILFGRRRAYLKKASLVRFGGLCSGDIIVIKAKTGRIAPELLPFVIQNDRLFTYAVSHSAGSLSPRVKWSDLSKWEFFLPDDDEQKKLAKVLWALDEAYNATKDLLAKTDDLIQARFVEMFGDPMEKSIRNAHFSDCVIINPGKIDIKKMGDIEVSFVPMECIGTDGSFSIKSNGKVSDFWNGYTCFKDGDVLLAKITPCFENGKMAIAAGCKNGIGFGTTEFHVFRPKDQISNAEWIEALLQNKRLHSYAAHKMTGSAGQKRVQASFFENLEVYLPPFPKQEEFALFVKQANESKKVLCEDLRQLSVLKNQLLNDTLFKEEQ